MIKAAEVALGVASLSSGCSRWLVVSPRPRRLAVWADRTARATKSAVREEVTQCALEEHSCHRWNRNDQHSHQQADATGLHGHAVEAFIGTRKEAVDDFGSPSRNGDA